LIEVELEWAEVMQASQVGLKRQISSLSKGHEHKHGIDQDEAWKVHILGAIAELACAKGLGMYWSGHVDIFKGADLGQSVQVRHTVLDDGCLIVREDDRDDEIFVLVTGRAPHLKIIGGASGHKAKNPKYAKAPNGRPPAYFVPQEDLADIDKIMGHLKGVAQNG
jgi:hypothetical protein